jgi:hypothetical protein
MPEREEQSTKIKKRRAKQASIVPNKSQQIERPVNCRHNLILQRESGLGPDCVRRERNKLIEKGDRGRAAETKGITRRKEEGEE